MSVEKITDAMRQKMLRKSAEILPNSPSKAGWTPQTIRNSLFQFATDEENSLLSEINRIVDEVNAYTDEMQFQYDVIIKEVSAGKYLGKSGFLYTKITNLGITSYTAIEYVGNGMDVRLPTWIWDEDGCHNINGIDMGANAEASDTMKILRVPFWVTKFKLVNNLAVPFSSILDTIFISSSVPTGLTSGDIPSTLATIFCPVRYFNEWNNLSVARVEAVPDVEDVYADMDEVITMILTRLYGDPEADYDTALSGSDFYRIKAAVQAVIDQLYGNGNDEYDEASAGSDFGIVKQTFINLQNTLWGNGTASSPADGSALDKIYDAVTAEAGIRSGADTTLQGNIDAEATARANADLALGGRIDSNDSDIASLGLRMGAAEGNITSLSAEIKGYARAFYCGNFLNFIQFLGGGNGVVDKDGNTVRNTELNTGDMVYIAETDVPDFWWQESSSASSAGAETYEYEGTTYELFSANIGYAHKVEIDDSALLGYTQQALDAKEDAEEAASNAHSYMEAAAGSASDAHDSEVAAEASAVAARQAVQNGAFIRFEFDPSDGKLYLIKIGESAYRFEIDNSTGILYIVY